MNSKHVLLLNIIVFSIVHANPPCIAVQQPHISRMQQIMRQVQQFAGTQRGKNILSIGLVVTGLTYFIWHSRSSTCVKPVIPQIPASDAQPTQPQQAVLGNVVQPAPIPSPRTLAVEAKASLPPKSDNQSQQIQWAIQRITENWDSRLIKAAKQNKTCSVYQALSEGANPNIVETISACTRLHTRKASPLIWAIAYNNTNNALLLLEHKANPNERALIGSTTSTHTTPLIEAAKRGNIEIMKLLTDYKADMKTVDSEERSAYDYLATTVTQQLLTAHKSLAYYYTLAEKNSSQYASIHANVREAELALKKN